MALLVMSTKNRKTPLAPVLSGKRSKANDSETEFIREPGFFPFARYVSVVGVHLTLTVFSTSPLLPTLTGRTLLSLNSMATVCCSLALLQVWWSGWVRNWSMEFSLGGTRDEMNIAKQKLNSRKLPVCFCFHFSRCIYQVYFRC